MKICHLSFVLALVAACGLRADDVPPGVSPGPDIRYATDAFPGFDNEKEVIKPDKKTPRWFSFIYGASCPNASEQLAWSRAREAEGSLGKARRGYDALVRAWPLSPEAPVAQQALAELLLMKEKDAEGAFYEYRYLLDFFSANCSYDAVAKRMFEIAEIMRAEGKRFVFFRFANTVDVRRAYESLILRAPGAAFVPEAMLTVVQLRVDEGKFAQAVAVCENIRARFPGTPAAKAAMHREASVRMMLLREHGYNRDRVADTISYLKLALRSDLGEAARLEIADWLAEAEATQLEEAYRSAKFYDSRTRTRQSAVAAYEDFLRDYPHSVHVDEVRARLEKLKEARQ